VGSVNLGRHPNIIRLDPYGGGLWAGDIDPSLAPAHIAMDGTATFSKLIVKDKNNKLLIDAANGYVDYGVVSLNDVASAKNSDTKSTANEGVNASVKKVKNLEASYSTDGKLDPEKLKAGLESGEITVNSQDADTGDTLLQLVIKENNFPAYEVLKGEGGIDINLTNNEGKTALHTAVIEQNDFFFGELVNYFMVKKQYKDNNGKYPIDYVDKKSTFYASLWFVEKV
jgi:hypothetical protein